MKKFYIPILAGILLMAAGCSNAGLNITPDAVASEIDKAESRYLMIKPMVDLILPFLSDSQQAFVRTAQLNFERALAVAKATSNAVILNDATDALNQMETVVPHN